MCCHLYNSIVILIWYKNYMFAYVPSCCVQLTLLWEFTGQNESYVLHILPHHCTGSQTRRPLIDSSSAYGEVFCLLWNPNLH